MLKKIGVDIDLISIMMTFFSSVPLTMMRSILIRMASAIIIWNSADIYAGGFSLYTEGSASAVGNFAAGIAAECRDASIGWYNPAGLSLLRKPEVLAGVVGVAPEATLSGTAYFYQRGNPESPEYLPYQQSFTNISGAREAIVPNLHIAIPVGERVTYGFSVVAPMGLSTSWPQDSALRYAGTLSALRMVDLSPEMGGRLSRNFSLGWGLDIEFSDVDFNNILGAPVALQLAEQVPTLWDTQLVNHGMSYGLGFHAGMLFLSDDQATRFGFNYQYGISHQFMDASRLQGPLADPENLDPNPTAIFTSPILQSNLIKFPDILTFSLYQAVSERVALMGSIVYTVWSPFKTIELQNVAAYDVSSADLIYANVATQQNYRNTVRVAVGMNYDIYENWQLRWGLGYDQTPTNNVDRDIRLPDVDKYAVALGLRWNLNSKISVDAGYSYLFPASGVTVNKTQILDPYNYTQVNATGHAHAQLLAIQAIWRA